MTDRPSPAAKVESGEVIDARLRTIAALASHGRGNERNALLETIEATALGGLSADETAPSCTCTTIEQSSLYGWKHWANCPTQWPQIADLHIRLRATRPSAYVGEEGYSGPSTVLVNPDGPKASAIISGLRRNLAREEQAVKVLQDRVADLHAALAASPPKIEDVIHGSIIRSFDHVETLSPPKIEQDAVERVVTEQDALRFLENAFRNIDIPPLDAGDLGDIVRGLRQFCAAIAKEGDA